MSKYTEGDIVEIRCVDIEQDSSWSTIESVRKVKPPPVKAVGYFLKEDNSSVTILSMYVRSSGNEEASYIVFPKELVKSIERIQESELDDFGEEK